MGYASKEALLEYTEKKGLNILTPILGVGGILLGILLFNTSVMGVLCTLLLGGSGVYLLFSDPTGKSSYKKYLDTAASTGELQRMLNDFASSKSLADDRIRLGAEYIYGKKMGRPLSYSELRKVYPYVVTGSGCARFLKGITADGQEHNLCEFIVKTSQKDPHPDESYIYQVILSKNPNVYLGYK